MKKALNLLAAVIFTCAFASLAQAQAPRTWVSGVGDDVNPCSRTAPCKTFAGAISKTAPCGEIDALDPGGFGTVTITKSITIDGTGTLAGIMSTSTNGITINVGSSDVVTLRGLTIDGNCNGLKGIRVINTTPKAVNIEDCVVFRFAGNGVDWATTGGTLGQLNIRNSVIRNNTGDGVAASASVGQVKGTFKNCSFVGNANGIHAKVNSRLTADHCQLSGNSSNGALADGSVGVIRISNSAINNNGANGVSASSGVVSINSCDIYNNALSGASGGAAVETYANNRIQANGTDGCASCTPRGFN
ncbi:MAG: right-handed parallel beta-helix repeat-containing protein [Pyrinomonadaceae bacterium]